MADNSEVTLHLVAGGNDAAVDVVFFHGLGGHHGDTWRHDQGFSWPHSLAQEAAGVRVWSLQYPASKFAWTKQGKRAVGGIQEIARNVRAEIASKQSLGLMQGDKPCVWVCHSLGGLIAKRLLFDNQNCSDAGDKLKDDLLQGILFLGTPHRGSDFADWGQKLLTVTKELGQRALSSLAQTFGWSLPVSNDLPGQFTELVKELENRNDGLWDLDSDFQSYHQKRWTDKKPLYVTVLAEGRSIFPGGMGPLIVDEISANPRLRTTSTANPIEPIVMQGLDHFDLSKPSSASSHQFRYLLDLRYRVCSEGGRYAHYFREAEAFGDQAVFHLQRQLDQQIYSGLNFLHHWCKLPALEMVDKRSSDDEKVVAIVRKLARNGDKQTIATTSMAMATQVLDNCTSSLPSLREHVDGLVSELLAFCAAPHPSQRENVAAHDLVSYPGYLSQRPEAKHVIDPVFLRAAQAKHKSMPTILPTQEGLITLQDLNSLDPTGEPIHRLEQWVYGRKNAQTTKEFSQQLSETPFNPLDDYNKRELKAEVSQRLEGRRYLMVDARDGMAEQNLLSQFEQSAILPILSLINAMPEDCAVEPEIKRAWENYASARSRHIDTTN